MVEERILRGQDPPEVTSKRGDPEWIASVYGGGHAKKPAEAGAITGQGLDTAHGER